MIANIFLLFVAAGISIALLVYGVGVAPVVVTALILGVAMFGAAKITARRADLG